MDLALDYLPLRGIVGGCRMGTGWDQLLIDQTFYPPPTQLLITHLKPSVNRYPAYPGAPDASLERPFTHGVVCACF